MEWSEELTVGHFSERITKRVSGSGDVGVKDRLHVPKERSGKNSDDNGQHVEQECNLHLLVNDFPCLTLGFVAD